MAKRARINDPLVILADKLDASMRAEFLRLVRDVEMMSPTVRGSKARFEDLKSLVANGNPDEVISFLGLRNDAAFSGLGTELRSAFNALGKKETEAIRKAAGLNTYWDDQRLTAENWARSNSSLLVTRVTNHARRNVRDTIASGIAQGKSQETIAYDLVGRINRSTGYRMGGVIGLTPDQSKWAVNFADRLGEGTSASLSRALGMELRDKKFDAIIRKAIEAGEPIPAKTRRAMAMAYRNNALLYRAKTIARTEINRARGEARTQSWQQQIDAGIVDQEGIERFWVTRHDDKVRHKHLMIERLNKDGVEWQSPFIQPVGTVMHAPHPDDPNCRCFEKIKYKR